MRSKSSEAPSGLSETTGPRIVMLTKSLGAHWRDVVVVLVALVVGNIVAEAAYRGYQYLTLPNRLFRVVSAMISTSSTGPPMANVFDAYTGWRYTPNFEGGRGHPWYGKYRTNSHGHVSSFEYPIRKPAGEYRIAVVGDSMSAGVTNNVRWPELLERDLNASQKWKASVNGKFTRVINFAVDGMGMVQFAGMVRHHVLAFEPDLILVNFVTDDILRKLWYQMFPTPGVDRDQGIRMFVRSHLDRIDWFSVRPELLAATVGRQRGWPSQLPLDCREILGASPAQRYTDRREAIEASQAAVRDMIAAFPNTLFLQIPLFQEIENHDIPVWRGLVADLRRGVPTASIVSMRPQMEALLEGKRLKDRPEFRGFTLHELTKLPDDRKPEIYRWYFLPEDTHYTDYGITLYEREVAKYLIERQPRRVGGANWRSPELLKLDALKSGHRAGRADPDQPRCVVHADAEGRCRGSFVPSKS
jgi:hypothetical protein